MENIERTQFVVLTGHLDDQPLADLIRTLRVQRKSGRLQVEYKDAPGSFFFEDGQLVDAQLGMLRGVEALYTALSLRGAAFNFNPLVRPPERSIDKQGQKFITDLIEAPRREALAEIRVADGAGLATAPQSAPLEQAALQATPAEFMAPIVERLNAVEAAILSTSRRFSRERLIYSLVISFLVGLILFTLFQIIYGPLAPVPAPQTAATAVKSNEANGAANVEAATPANKEQPAAVPAQLERTGNSQQTDVTKTANAAAPEQTRADAPELAGVRYAEQSSDVPAGNEYVVRVRMRVKNGQVIGARVLNARAEASAYEARALKLAMQRRYPDNFTGGDTLKIMVARDR